MAQLDGDYLVRIQDAKFPLEYQGGLKQSCK